MMTNHPKRRVFYSFHYDADAWRAAQARNIGVTEHNSPVSDNKWEEIKRGGDRAIQRWIDDQMATRSCVVVLVGARTVDRPWIRYEIVKAWNDQKGLPAIHIHKLLNQDSKPANKGGNPFARIILPSKVSP